LSEIRATTISDAAGTGPIALTGQSAAKAWFSSYSEGTVNESLNISSAIDNGSGDGTYNFSNSFSSTQYAVLSGNAYRRLEYHDGINTGSIRYITVDPNASQTNKVGYAENSGLSVGMLGDLA
jgi:hypothetical protein